MRRILRVAAAASLAAATLGSVTASGAPAGDAAFSGSRTVTRVHLVDGKDQVAESRTVGVRVSTTDQLRDRQAITVSWTGAHPTGGLVADHNSAAAANEEYPVVIMQCRGVDSASAPAAKRVSPETCWTQTPAERFQYSPDGFIYPPYRMDRYATTEERAYAVGQPDPLPQDCPAEAVPHWVPFRAVDGTVYPGGVLGCAGMAPEAANAADSLQPGNTTYGVSDASGNGSAKFVVQTAETNASLGCSASVPCTLEVIPIIGISCDAAGTADDAADRGLPAPDRPPASLLPRIQGDCGRTGHFAPGSYNGGGETPDLAVTGQLWWSPSNWRNRVSVPLTMAPSATLCDVVNNAATLYLYGSEAMQQATQQWAPHFCLDPKLYVLRHVQTSETQAKNLLGVGSVEAALQGAPPKSPFDRPVVQAPVAVSGFAIAYSVDGNDGSPTGRLRLDARLIAKLLSESYRSCTTCLDFDSDHARRSGFSRMAGNPIDITRDPEFQALNPGIPKTNYLESAATLAVMSSDSDVMHALSSYIDADPEARQWLDGVPDPWGMVVNPAYRDIALPVDDWPLLDTNIAKFPSGSNQCLEQDPVPWLPLVAAPVSNPATVALNMQFDIANSQVFCKNNGQQNEKLTGVGRQAPGQRFLLGLVSLADAARYQLNTAQLQTQNTSTDQGEFETAAGRSFVGPTSAGLRAAAAQLAANDALGTWTVRYDQFRTTTGGRAAYPGLMLLSADIPTQGLPKTDARRYAQFLRFAIGSGQVPGVGIGDLPDGYLPIDANPATAALARYTRIAADHVERQTGVVPQPSDPKEPVVPSSPPSSSHPPAPSSSGSTPSPGGASSSPPVVAASSSSGPGTSPKPSASATDLTTPNAVAAGKTSALSSNPLALALPVLAGLALVALALAGWTSGVGRRR